MASPYSDHSTLELTQQPNPILNAILSPSHFRPYPFTSQTPTYILCPNRVTNVPYAPMYSPQQRPTLLTPPFSRRTLPIEGSYLENLYTDPTHITNSVLSERPTH